jgi:mRNA-degrading endonuclease RelE of RelBE toxin-antitoxin system
MPRHVTYPDRHDAPDDDDGIAIAPLDRYAPTAYTGYITPTGVNAKMVFIETSIFTRQVLDLLTDEEYRELQKVLANRPDAGPLIVGSGGLRKIRWAKQGRGKRGGVRIIYYWAVSPEQILMLFMYPKGERDDLTPAQIKMLKQIVEEAYP